MKKELIKFCLAFILMLMIFFSGRIMGKFDLGWPWEVLPFGLCFYAAVKLSQRRRL